MSTFVIFLLDGDGIPFSGSSVLGTGRGLICHWGIAINDEKLFKDIKPHKYNIDGVAKNKSRYSKALKIVLYPLKFITFKERKQFQL